jgi:large subunit ribosomal protein L18
MAKKSRAQARVHRHLRVRSKIEGTAERPRLNVFRSISEIYAQLIDDAADAPRVCLIGRQGSCAQG